MTTTMTQPTLATAPPPPPGPEPAIRVEGLRKAYGGRTVLDGLSFEVDPGEIFGILGLNGMGKTTAVEIAQGLRSRDAGSVRVLGLDPERDPARLRPLVGSQLQSSALPERLRVGEALRLFTRLAGDVVDWRALADEWDLTRLRRSAFVSLSGGERQRLFIALALANRPRVVFLDELTQGLDPAARQATWRLVERVRDQGATVVLVTHFMDEAARLCDRLGVLQDGGLIACGTPKELVSAAGGSVRIAFSCERTADLAGLDRVPGVIAVAHDGRHVEIEAQARASVLVAAELARRDLAPPDFTVTAPTLEDVFVSLTQGVAR